MEAHGLGSKFLVTGTRLLSGILCWGSGRILYYYSAPIILPLSGRLFYYHEAQEACAFVSGVPQWPSGDGAGQGDRDPNPGHWAEDPGRVDPGRTPNTTTTDYQNHHSFRLCISSIQGFIIGTYKNHGFGSQYGLMATICRVLSSG